MSQLFSKPKVPIPPLPEPPTPPPQNTQLQAQLQQLGRRQGLMAALFGAKTPSGPSSSKKLTGD